MKYFVAKLVFRIISGDGRHKPQFDEQLRLINAYTAAEAFEKAVHLGRGEEEAFLNEKSEIVHWQFINIAELKAVQLTDGAELYAKILEKEDAAAYCTFVNRRAEALREQHAMSAETNI